MNGFARNFAQGVISRT